KKGAAGGSGVRKGEGDAPAEPSGGDETQTQIEEKNAVGSKRTTEDNPAGDVQRVTVGVLIPVEEGAAMTAKERELPALRSFVLAAAGPQARMEDISVQLVPTKKPEPIAAAAESDRVALWISAHWLKVVLALLVIAAFFFI